MFKPVLKTMPTAQDIAAMEAMGYVFETYDNKRIVGEASSHGYKILFLEDGTDIVFDASDNITTWVEEEGANG